MEVDERDEWGWLDGWRAGYPAIHGTLTWLLLPRLFAFRHWMYKATRAGVCTAVLYYYQIDGPNLAFLRKGGGNEKICCLRLLLLMHFAVFFLFLFCLNHVKPCFFNVFSGHVFYTTKSRRRYKNAQHQIAFVIHLTIFLSPFRNVPLVRQSLAISEAAKERILLSWVQIASASLVCGNLAVIRAAEESILLMWTLGQVSIHRFQSSLISIAARWILEDLSVVEASACVDEANYVRCGFVPDTEVWILSLGCSTARKVPTKSMLLISGAMMTGKIC